MFNFFLYCFSNHNQSIDGIFGILKSAYFFRFIVLSSSGKFINNLFLQFN